MDEIEGLVLDASALLAYLQGEPGSDVVQVALAAGAVFNIVNDAEVLSRLGDAGEEPAAGHQHLQGLIVDTGKARLPLDPQRFQKQGLISGPPGSFP